ncbi:MULTISPECIES: MCE family protein [Dietzia]|uniref:Mammalian cell entry protein n=1 Tax=Dietzia psychralcaliphila TaxID=139021 RepID=A0AAD0JNR7_9ACTN|nr:MULTISPECIES: MCE family protein [Dietzia]AVZ38681.1 mammalian cell entry protein [Dietzia sp. JS16-p6b]AWH94715.1 mammalian cell entry protein [Dietzia psychralcaliphila]MBB1023827.1 MCE family protein [Dietzia sp. DQ12-76]MBB1028606.1 MCE family protein [Dietzia sp. DQ11-38-2]MBB1033987.1 MCE family protein [Dietzia sp. CQ4]
MSRLLASTLSKVVALVVVVLLVIAAVWFFSTRTKTIVAFFESTRGVYEDDTVRVLGVRVGRISEITSEDGRSKVTMKVDRDVPVPADATALLVAQSLVAERFIQITPAFTGGEEMPDGGTIPVERTAIPVEWDGVKEQLMKLSTALSPVGHEETGPLGEFVDSADAMLDGNGVEVRDALNEVSQTMALLSDGRENLFTTLKNLQLFVTALSQSEEQIVSFGGKLASVSQVLGDQTGDIDAALSDLDLAVTDINRFLDNNGERVTTAVDKLGQATEVVRDRRAELEGVLHVGPTAMANFYNIYRPYQGVLTGVLTMNQMANPTNFICGAIAGLANNTAESDAQLCAQYMGPLFNSLASSYPYGAVTPPITPTAEPQQIWDSQKPGTQTPPGVQPVSDRPDPLINVVNKGDNLTDTLLVTGDA